MKAKNGYVPMTISYNSWQKKPWRVMKLTVPGWQKDRGYFTLLGAIVQIIKEVYYAED